MHRHGDQPESEASGHMHDASQHHADIDHDDADHGHDHGESVEDEHADDPAVQAYLEANERMHAGMTQGFTGNPDVDFARGMIPHHRGAIDMAEVLLEHGEDEELKALAREIIDAQEEEIAFLKQWLERHGH
ncbi:DUF305 domain-containing protein [Halomonas sp. PA5]|nr:DUF305 domain-containing protein [Halomonas sp. PA5]